MLRRFVVIEGVYTRILIVDDNLGLAFILQMILEGEGYEVRTAKDGREGYFTYLLFRPDLIISDVQMPGTNGFELIKQIRRHDPDIKTIYMSADFSVLRSLPEEEKERQYVGFLEKPFSKTELIRLIAEYLKRSMKSGHRTLGVLAAVFLGVALAG